MEAFSDGVIAILITIMVLELKVPEGTDFEAIRPLMMSFLTYVLSFIYLGIYWNNHHHLLHATDHVDGRILWANLHLLFWLSLITFATGWMAENHLAPVATAVYGAVLLMCALAYTILQIAIIKHGGPNARLREAIGKDIKGKVSLVLYVLSVPLAFANPWISVGIFVFVACMWLIPDRRIELSLEHTH
jgi:uncharacterized membrane protein